MVTMYISESEKKDSIVEFCAMNKEEECYGKEPKMLI